MSHSLHQDLLKKLAEICQLSPDVRFGQVLANLGVLAEDQFDRTLWEVDDEQLLAVIERHRHDLARRQSNVA